MGQNGCEIFDCQSVEEGPPCRDLPSPRLHSTREETVMLKKKQFTVWTTKLDLIHHSSTAQEQKPRDFVFGGLAQAPTQGNSLRKILTVINCDICLGRWPTCLRCAGFKQEVDKTRVKMSAKFTQGNNLENQILIPKAHLSKAHPVWGRKKKFTPK